MSSANYLVMDPATYTSPTRELLSLRGEWRYRPDPDNRGLAEGWRRGPATEFPSPDDRSCTLPGAVQALGGLSEYPSPAGFPNGYLGTVWFHRAFRWRPAAADSSAEAARGSRDYLIAGGIAPAAHLYLDGTYLGYHSLPMVTGEWDVTELLDPSRADHEITVVLVEQDTAMMGGYRFAGHAWSGVFRDIWLERRPSVHVRGCWLRSEGDHAVVHADVVVSGGAVEPATGGDPGGLAVSAMVGGRELRLEPAGEAAAGVPFEGRMPVGDVPLWRVDAPELLDLAVTVAETATEPGRAYAAGDEANEVGARDRVERRTGVRSFTAGGERLLEHGQPIFLAGAGQEFHSPSISPLVDRKAIRERMEALRRAGFRFYRYHTHVPTPEEVQLADELGLYLSAEVSVVSNFAQVKPFDRGLEMLRAYVYQSRHHASLAVYCLGNEGTQVMVRSETSREQARVAYDAVHELAPDRLVMAAFGSQGELPEQPNDVESPHLWSHEFRWGHDGLTRVPWWGMRDVLDRSPALVHEYGKFGVWPDARDADAHLVGGYHLRPAEDAPVALADAGIAVGQARVADASRALAATCTRLILEDARRARGVDGYVLWTFFRMGPRNGGIANDAGVLDLEPSALANATGQVALLSDLGFDRRTVPAGSSMSVELTIATTRGLEPSLLEVRVDGSAVTKLEVPPVEAGEDLTTEVSVVIPRVREIREVQIAAALHADGVPVATRTDTVWAVPDHDAPREEVVIDAADPALRGLLPRAIAAEEYDAVVRGCRTWEGAALAEAFDSRPPRLVVTDHLGPCFRLARERAIPVLLVDTGHFPETWYPPGYPEGAYDVFRMYVPFRAGWDQGNVATIVEESDLLEGVPHHGWCDLAWFNAIHGASSLRTGPMRSDLRADVRPIVRVIPRLRPAATTPVVQDPNAIRELAGRLERTVRTDDRGYLFVAGSASGPGADEGLLVITSLRHGADPFARAVLAQLTSRMIEGRAD